MSEHQNHSPETGYIFAEHHDPVLRQELLGLGVGKNSRILNIACEYRFVPEFLADVVDPENVFGLELNEEIIRKNPHIRLCNVDEDPFPFEDGSFDFVLSIWGLEHFQKENIFRESCRVLKKGGVMVFMTPNLRHPIFLFNRMTAGKVSKVFYKYIIRSPYVPHQTHYHFNTVPRLRRVSDACGLEFKRLNFLGPTNILEYFAFSKIAGGLVKILDQAMTNKVLGFMKPYLVCVFKK